MFINEIILAKNTWQGHVYVYSCIWVRAGISSSTPWSASISCATVELCRTILTQGTGGAFVQLNFKMCFTRSRCCKTLQTPLNQQQFFFSSPFFSFNTGRFLFFYINASLGAGLWVLRGESWVDRAGSRSPWCPAHTPMASIYLFISAPLSLQSLREWCLHAGRAGKLI